MRVLIDVWSDYVCPFCYLEEPVLKQVEREFGNGVEIRWRAYELRPEPVQTLDPAGDYLRNVWTRSVYPMATERKMILRQPPVQPRSRLAHEAAQFAGAQGAFEAMNHELFKAFFEHGRDIGDRAVLVDLGKTAGVDPDALSRALTSGAYRDRVLADQALAKLLKISGVPALIVRRENELMELAVNVSGAQPFDYLSGVLKSFGA